MLAVPDWFKVGWAAAAAANIAVGGFFSIPKVWEKFSPILKLGSKYGGGTYLKAGEYGETEISQTWSVFKEPLNALSSLTYSFFGAFIIFVDIHDTLTSSNQPDLPTENLMQASASFSILYGVSCGAVGLASFFFHASHSEFWRKLDAGMTSGVMMAPLMFAICDRARPPAATVGMMVGFGALLQISLTHGYLPYGSSDILLPSFVAMCWTFELYSRYQGPMDPPSEYNNWLQCAYGAIGGMLLRALDIKRKQPIPFKNILGLFYLITVVPFGIYTRTFAMIGFFAGIVVTNYPYLGHLAWHVASAYALYIWWLNYRLRPGNPEVPYSVDRDLINVLLFVAIKNAVRRLFMTASLPWPLNKYVSSLAANANNSSGNTSAAGGAAGANGGAAGGSGSKTSAALLTEEVKDRIMILLEHVVFVYFAFEAIVAIPERNGTAGDPSTNYYMVTLNEGETSYSWLLTPRLNWTKPIFPNELFVLYYMAKTGTHVEDLLYGSMQAIRFYLLCVKVGLRRPTTIPVLGAIVQSLAAKMSLSPSAPAVSSSSSGAGAALGAGAAASASGSVAAVGVSSSVRATSPVSTPEASPMDSEAGSRPRALSDGKTKEQLAGEEMSETEAFAALERSVPDANMMIHHLTTGALCVLSYYCGYAKIGSLVMFLHDISDIPLDLVRLSKALQMKYLLVPSFVLLVCFWFYWRLWFFPTTVLYSIAVQAKSTLIETECEIGECTWAEVPERVPFLAMLGTLYVLNVVWFVAIVQKGYRELVGGGKRNLKVAN